MFLAKQLNSDVSLPPLVLAEFEQALMVMFLYANRHNYSNLLQEDPADVALRQVRRTEDYIEANWNKQMSFEALAAEIGVSIRSLFRSFRKSRGYSPAEFLRQTRLRHAQWMLQRAEAGTKEADIARRCGFLDLDNFRRAYLKAFGERPSETRKRSDM